MHHVLWRVRASGCVFKNSLNFGLAIPFEISEPHVNAARWNTKCMGGACIAALVSKYNMHAWQETDCTDFLEPFPQHLLHQMPTVLSSFCQLNISSSGKGNIRTISWHVDIAFGSSQSFQLPVASSCANFVSPVSEFGTSKSNVLVRNTASEFFCDPFSPSSCLLFLHRKALQRI